MFRRRKKSGDVADGIDPAQPAAGDEPADGEPADGEPADGQPAEPEPPVKPARPNGPWDVDEVDLSDPAEAAGRVDLGGLLLRGRDGMQLQLQVDEASQRVTAAMVVLGDSAVQLLPVAAPRSTPVWPETRAEMAADARRRGGRVEEADGPFGPELRVLLPVALPDGKRGVQPSRVVGIDGPRWLLRATFLGRATQDEEAFEQLAQVVRDVVVVRGSEPMAPGDLIPLRIPTAAGPEPPSAESGEDKPTLEDLDPGPTVTEIR